MPRGARGSKGNVVAQRARRAARKRAAEAQLVLAARENPANPAGHQARKPPRKTPQIFITRDRAPKSRSVYSLRELAIEAGQKRTAEQAHLELANREKRRRDLAATSSSGQAVQNLTPNPAVQVQAKSSEQDRLGIVDREQHDRRPIVAPPRRDSAVDPVQKETTNQGQLGSAASGQAADIALLLNVAVESPARTLGRRISNIQLNSRSENMTGGSFLPQQVADGDAAKLDKDILAAAIFAPAPPFDKDEEGLQDRDDFLRDAIANVEVHHEKVRANIVASWSTQNQDVERQLESVLNATCQPEDDEKAARIATMLANISTPYKVEDGSLVAPLLPNSSMDTMKLLEEYTKRSQKHVDTYRRALDRRGSLRGSGGVDSRRTSHGDIVMGESPISRPGSTIPIPTVRGGMNAAAINGGDTVMGGTDEALAPPPPPPALKDTYHHDASRDPRLMK